MINAIYNNNGERRNALAATLYAKAEEASMMADFALDMLESAHRTGMDVHSSTYEALRLNTVARIEAAMHAMERVNLMNMHDAYVKRYNDIMDAAL